MPLHIVFSKILYMTYRYRFLVIGSLRKEILILNVTIYMETLIVVGADELVLMGRYIHLFIYHFCMLIVFHYGLARCVRNILKRSSY
jgi:hypothetical protein